MNSISLSLLVPEILLQGLTITESPNFILAKREKLYYPVRAGSFPSIHRCSWLSATENRPPSDATAGDLCILCTQSSHFILTITPLNP